MRLSNKIALVTGAASGIGRAGAILFASQGAAVAVVDREREALDEVIGAIQGHGGKAVGIVADLANPHEARSSVNEAAQVLGGLDIMWCNAGITGPTDVQGLNLSELDATIAVNQTAIMLGTAEAIPHLIRRGGGSIIITSSTSGIVGSVAGAVYSATKFALVGWAKSLALRVAADNIRVNALCPGPAATPLLLKVMREGAGDLSGAEYSARILAGIPMGRLADPIDVAHAALWLASDESSYVTGIALPIDGGYTSR